jgi:hypothetical protein
MDMPDCPLRPPLAMLRSEASRQAGYRTGSMNEILASKGYDYLTSEIAGE